VLKRADRAVLGERPRVPASELAAVQRDREDLAIVTRALTRRPTSVGSSESSQVSKRKEGSGETRSTQRRSQSGVEAGNGAITARFSISRSIGRQRSVR
jgi:hypothetical protein